MLTYNLRKSDFTGKLIETRYVYPVRIFQAQLRIKIINDNPTLPAMLIRIGCNIDILPRISDVSTLMADTSDFRVAMSENIAACSLAFSFQRSSLISKSTSSFSKTD